MLVEILAHGRGFMFQVCSLLWNNNAYGGESICLLLTGSSPKREST
jgi:hypothetical protein